MHVVSDRKRGTVLTQLTTLLSMLRILIIEIPHHPFQCYQKLLLALESQLLVGLFLNGTVQWQTVFLVQMEPWRVSKNLLAIWKWETKKDKRKWYLSYAILGHSTWVPVNCCGNLYSEQGLFFPGVSYLLLLVRLLEILPVAIQYGDIRLLYHRWGMGKFSSKSGDRLMQLGFLSRVSSMCVS